jgi:hypothetical protein
MSAAIAAMPMGTRDNAFIEGGWADEIGSVAEKALSVFLRRGRFDEEKEEVEPSG